MTFRTTTLAILVLLPLLGACHGRRHHHTPVVVTPAPPNLVSIEVEVYDPVSNFVWQDVGVRIVEAYTEWSGLTRPNAIPDDFFLTDASGVVLFTEFELGDADVGFAEDTQGRALLESGRSRDEAVVTLEVWAAGFDSVFVDVELTWGEPDVFVAVPFE